MEYWVANGRGWADIVSNSLAISRQLFLPRASDGWRATRSTAAGAARTGAWFALLGALFHG